MVLTASDVEKYVFRFERTVKDPRKRALKQLDIAKLYKEAKCFDQATECIREYLIVNPNDHRAYNILGSINENLKQWEDALKSYKRSIDLQRSQKDILIKVVEMFAKVPLTEPQIAKVWADKAENLFPNHPAVFSLRWHLLMGVGEKDFEEIEDLLAHELVRNPRDPKLHIKLLELYTEKGDFEEAYVHCISLLSSRVFQDNQDWLMCAAEVFENYYQETNDEVAAAESFMNFVEVLCSLIDVTFQKSSFHLAKDVFCRLDKAVGEAYTISSPSLPEHILNEIEVFQTEARGQIYFHLATLILKMGQEHELSWNVATRLACACLAVSSSVREPDTKVAWLQQKASPDNQKMNWHTMACTRLSQTDHVILSMEKRHGVGWIKNCVADICSEAGKQNLVQTVYGESKISRKSFFVMDKEFFKPEFDLPDIDTVFQCDEVALVGRPNNFSQVVWVGLNWHVIENHLKTDGLVGDLFYDIQVDTTDLQNCSPFTLSSMDLDIFVQAVVHSTVDRLISNDDDENKDEMEPLIFPLSISHKLNTNAQFDWWDAAYKLHTGKTWQASTSKLQSVLQHGLETLRLIGNHGIDPRILKRISDMFLKKAKEIIDDRPNEWRNQLLVESLKTRGFHYGDNALKILEISESDRDVMQPKAPLIPPLQKPIDADERNELIEGLRMKLAYAALDSNSYDDAFSYLGGLFTFDSAYKEAQIYRELAFKENHSNVEGLRNHLSYLRKAREKLQTCLGRLKKSQTAARAGIQAELDEIHDAISEQRGITAAPSTLLDFRYNLDEEREEEENNLQEDAPVSDSKLVLENSILHEQLAVRNHEFSVLAARIHKLEREMADMRVNQSGHEEIIKPRQSNSAVNTDESASSIISMPKDDATSGSGNLTPRLEPEMSWDPFSPSPVFPAPGYFSGLAETVERIEEETEGQIKDATDGGGSRAEESKEVSDKAEYSGLSIEKDTSTGDGDTSHGDSIHVEPVVHLTEKTDQKTGEENETVMFQERAKLYRLSSGQWKERGIGDLKILLNAETTNSRLLMRRDQVFRLCANHLILKDMKLEKKQGTTNTFIWYTAADMSEDTPTPETFAVRFKNEAIADSFAKCVKDCQDQIKDVSPLVDVTEGKEEEKSGNKINVIASSLQPDKNIQENNGFSFTAPTVDFSLKSEGKPKQSDSNVPKFSFQLQENKDSIFSFNTQAGGKESSSAFSKEPMIASQLAFSQATNEVPTSEHEEPLSTGFAFDLSKFSFNFGNVAAPTTQDKDAKTDLQGAENPFLAAFQRNFQSAPSSTISEPQNANEQTNQLGFSSPFNFQHGLPHASTPLNAFNYFQVSQASQAGAQPTEGGFDLPATFSPQVLQNQAGNLQQNIVMPRVNQSYTAGQGSDGNLNTDQAMYFQESEWEERQDRYYEDGVYDDNNGYYDESTYYENDDYDNGGQLYDASDVYYADTEGYYANGEEEFEYYDQEPARPVPTADSDANSDRLSPRNEVTDSSELVPHVVQMIDDDIFVTYVKKASFAQRARASRLMLPSHFFAPSSNPPCSGCRGCQDSDSDLVSENTQRDIAVATVSPRVSCEAEQKLVSGGVDSKLNDNFTGRIIGEEKQQLLSFSDLVSGTASSSFGGSPDKGMAGFSGAGAVLFTAKADENPEEFDPHFIPIVELKKQENVKTGEEGYVDLFKSRAKLYRFDHETRQWKERGVGEMKLSHNPENNYCRVLMRRDQVHKLCANHPTMPSVALKPHGLSATAWVWVSGADYAEGEPRVEQFAVKFKKVEIANDFKRVFEECQGIIQSYLVDNNLTDEIENGSQAIVSKKEKELKKEETNKKQPEKILFGKDATKVDDSVDNTVTDSKSIWSQFGAKKDGWECSVCFVSNKPDAEKCVSCATNKPGVKVVPVGAPDFGQKSSSNDSKSMWSQFSAKKDDWECSVCLVSNKPDAEKCVSCATNKPGVKVVPAGAPVFGKKTSNSGTFGTINFPKFGTENSPFTGFGARPKEAVAEQIKNGKDCETEGNTLVLNQSKDSKVAGSSIWSSFLADNDSWECSGCLVTNKGSCNKCPCCSTLKAGTALESRSGEATVNQEKITVPDVQSSAVSSSGAEFKLPASFSMFGNAQSTFGKQNTSFGGFQSETPSSGIFGPATGGTFSFGGSSSPANSFAMSSFGLGLLSNKDTTPQDQTEEKESSKHDSGSWECQTCSVKNVNGTTLCESCRTENSPEIKVSPQIVLKRSPLSEPIGSELGFAHKPGSWECPTCAIFNDKETSVCPACETINPSNGTKTDNSNVNLSTQLFSDKTALKSIFTHKPGSWECPTCSIVNDKDKSNCPACTTQRPNTGVSSNSDSLPSTKSTPSFNFGERQKVSSTDFRSPSSSGFNFGKFNTETPKSEFSFYGTPNPQQDANTENKSLETTQFFTPTGIFSFNTGASPAKGNDVAKTPESPSKEDDYSLHFDPIVNLRKINLETGEENEKILFNEKAKLYRFDAEVKQWKERGVGELKILHKSGGRYRLIMRRDQVRKICANHALVKGMSLKPMANSEKARIWSTLADYAEEEVKGETFAVRFRSVELVKEFEHWFMKSVEDSEKLNDKSVTVEEEKDSLERDPELEEKAENGEVPRNSEVESIPGSKNIESVSGNKKEEFDLKLTEEVLPPIEQQEKAKKLLLPKEFFNKPSKDEPKLDGTTEETRSLNNTPIQRNVSDSNTSTVSGLNQSTLPTINNDISRPSEEGSASPEKFQEEDCKALFTPIVQLAKIEMTTGEESDEVLFCSRAKVYRLDSTVPQWKERGVGELKILKKKNGTVRILMRRDQVKKICLNHYILSGMKLEPSNMSKNTVIWFTHADYAEEAPQEEKFAAKFRSEDIVKEFEDCFNIALKNDSESNEIGFSAVAEVVGHVTSLVSGETSSNVILTTPASSNVQTTDNSFPSTTLNRTKPTEVFSWSGKTGKPLFSFGSSSDAVDEVDKTDAGEEENTEDQSGKEELSKPFTFGTSHGSFSFGVSDNSVQQKGDVATVKGNDQIEEATSVNDPPQQFGFMLKGVEPVKGPFSFWNSSSTVEDVSNEVKSQSSNAEKPNFNWTFSAKSPNEKAGVVDFGFNAAAQDGGKDIDEAKIVESLVETNTLGSPGKLHEEEECKVEFEAIVSLETVLRATGEENEHVVFSEKAKVYRFDNDVRQWKERGVGELKILKNLTTEQHRILLRRDQVKKIAVNHVIMKDMTLKKNNATKNSYVWFTNADFADEIPKAEQLAAKFRNQETADQFSACFETILEKLNAFAEPEEISSTSETTVKADMDEVSFKENIVSFESRSTAKSTGQVVCEKSEDSKPLEINDDDVCVLYFKEPTLDERSKATRLLLPVTFFMTPNEMYKNPQDTDNPQDTEIKTNSSTNDSYVGKPQDVFGFGSNLNTEVSFSDLVSSTEGTFTGFQGSSPQGFKGKGAALFQSSNKGDGEEEYDPHVNFKPIVTLSKKEAKTGEEDETVLFADRCKLYRMDTVNSQWKERGVGEMKILRSLKQRTHRIVMRRDVVHKLGANHLIREGMVVTPKQGNEAIWMWKANADISDGESREELFTVKFKTAEVGRCFAKTFRECIESAKEPLTEQQAEEESDSEDVSREDSRGESYEKNREESHEDNREESREENREEILEDNLEERASQPDTETCDATAKITGEDDSKPPETEKLGTQYDSEKETTTFGSGFSGLDFSSIASDNSNAFKTDKKGGFANAGAQLFGASASGNSEEHHPDPHFDPIVQLEQIETKTGEEDEVALFSERVKLFRFSVELKQWKERGIGLLKLLCHKETGKGRLLMRREMVHKVAANHSLIPDMKLEKMKMSARTWMWKTMADVSDGDPAEALLAARFKSDDMLKEFRQIFESLCEGNEIQSNTVPEEPENVQGQSIVGSCSPAVSDSFSKLL